jgi:hypothetical protein
LTHLRKIALRVVVVTLVAAVALELTLRALLFGTAPTLRRWGAPLRVEGRYAAENSVDEWKLRALFHRRGQRVHRNYDPIVGYRKKAVLASYRHVGERHLEGRRPVLLYGDSFAACVAEAGPRWEGLLEQSDLADRFAILNYGVGGYGLDQAILLLEQSVDHYLDDDPVVILSFLVDDDLHRCLLPLREHPKPFFTLDEGRLVLHPAPPLSAKGFVREYPPAISSYAVRSIASAFGGVGREDRAAETRALVRELLLRVEDFLDERGVAYFFLLFHAHGSLSSEGPFGWEEPFLHSLLRKQEIPFVSSKRFLLDDAGRTGNALHAYFFAGGAAKNHYNAKGNRVVVQALRAGLLGHFEPGEAPPDGPPGGR